MLPTKPYNQRERDPATFRLSMGVIVGLVGIGMMLGGQPGWGFLALTAGVCVALSTIFG